MPREISPITRTAAGPLLPRLGQTNVEYGAILVLVSIVAVALLTSIGNSVITMLSAPLAGF